MSEFLRFKYFRGNEPRVWPDIREEGDGPSEWPGIRVNTKARVHILVRYYIALFMFVCIQEWVWIPAAIYRCRPWVRSRRSTWNRTLPRFYQRILVRPIRSQLLSVPSTYFYWNLYNEVIPDAIIDTVNFYSFSIAHSNNSVITGPSMVSPNSAYPPNHPLSGSKHLCSICGDRASGKHYGVYRWVETIIS